MSTGDTQSLLRRVISTEADTNSSITGINVMGESANTMKALQTDASGYLKVSIEVDNASIGGGTEYNEDAATPSTIAGTSTLMERDDALSSLTPVEAYSKKDKRCDERNYYSSLASLSSGKAASTFFLSTSQASPSCSTERASFASL